MRILGIDCGCETTGFGVIDSDGRIHRFIAAGEIHTAAGAPLAGRLARIHQGLSEILSRYRPDAVAVEAIFHAVNVRTALQLAQARGVALLAAAQAGLPVSEYAPLLVKNSVVGYGRAGKHQVQTMVASLLGLAAPPGNEDACDALAVAICHSTAGALKRKLAAGAR